MPTGGSLPENTDYQLAGDNSRASAFAAARAAINSRFSAGAKASGRTLPVTPAPKPVMQSFTQAPLAPLAPTGTDTTWVPDRPGQFLRNAPAILGGGQYVVNPTTGEKAKVIEVIDGDTMDVDLNGVRERVRYAGIDTPETKHPVLGTQPGGPEASAYNTSAFPAGSDVTLESNTKPRDVYGRLLKYPWNDKNQMVGQDIVQKGFGSPDQYKLEVNKYPGRVLGGAPTSKEDSTLMESRGFSPIGNKIDYITPLWADGRDVLENRQIIDNASYEKKLAIQAVPLTLFSNGYFTGTIEQQRAKARQMAMDWQVKDAKGLPSLSEIDLNGGYVPLDVAKRYADKWVQDEKDKTGVQWSDVWDSMKHQKDWGEKTFGKGVMGGLIRETAKSALSVVSFGYIPYEKDDDYVGGAAQAAAIAGGIAGGLAGFIPILGAVRGAGWMLGGMNKGLRQLGMLNNLTSKLGPGSKLVRDIEKAGDAAEVGKILTKGGALPAGSAQMVRIAKDIGVFATYGQLSAHGIVGQIASGHETEWGKQLIMDVALGGAMGKFTMGKPAVDAVKVAGTVMAVDAAVRSDDPDWDIQSSFFQGLTMGGLHYYGLKMGGSHNPLAVRNEIVKKQFDPKINTAIFSKAKDSPEMQKEIIARTGISQEKLDIAMEKARKEMDAKLMPTIEEVNAGKVDYEKLTNNYIAKMWNAREMYIRDLPFDQQHAARISDIRSMLTHVAVHPPTKVKLIDVYKNSGVDETQLDHYLFPTVEYNPFGNKAAVDKLDPEVIRVGMTGTESELVKRNLEILKNLGDGMTIGKQAVLVVDSAKGYSVNRALGGKYEYPDRHGDVYAVVFDKNGKVYDRVLIGTLPVKGKVAGTPEEKGMNENNPEYMPFKEEIANKDAIIGKMFEAKDVNGNPAPQYLKMVDIEWLNPAVIKGGRGAGVIQIPKETPASIIMSEKLNYQWNKDTGERMIRPQNFGADDNLMMAGDVHIDWMNAVTDEFATALKTGDPAKFVASINKTWGKNTITEDIAEQILLNEKYSIGDMFKLLKSSPKWKASAYILDPITAQPKLNTAAKAYENYKNTMVHGFKDPSKINLDKYLPKLKEGEVSGVRQTSVSSVPKLRPLRPLVTPIAPAAQKPTTVKQQKIQTVKAEAPKAGTPDRAVSLGGEDMKTEQRRYDYPSKKVVKRVTEGPKVTQDAPVVAKRTIPQLPPKNTPTVTKPPVLRTPQPVLEKARVKAPKTEMTREEQYGKDKALWEQLAKENPQLIEELRVASAGKPLTDMFASSDINQARALSEVFAAKPTIASMKAKVAETKEAEAIARGKGIEIVKTPFGKAPVGDIVYGMRSGGNNITNTLPGQPGWLGNPVKANDTLSHAKDAPNREGADVEYRKIFNAKIESDPAFRKAILGLRGKKVGYYAPTEQVIHLQVIDEWLRANPESPAAKPTIASMKAKVAETKEAEAKVVLSENAAHYPEVAGVSNKGTPLRVLKGAMGAKARTEATGRGKIPKIEDLRTAFDEKRKVFVEEEKNPTPEITARKKKSEEKAAEIAHETVATMDTEPSWSKFEQWGRGRAPVSQMALSVSKDPVFLKKYTQGEIQKRAKQLSMGGTNQGDVVSAWPEFLKQTESDFAKATGDKNYKITDPTQLRELHNKFDKAALAHSRKEMNVTIGEDGVGVVSFKDSPAVENFGRTEMDRQEWVNNNRMHSLKDDAGEIVEIGELRARNYSKDNPKSSGRGDEDIELMAQHGYVPFGHTGKGNENQLFMKTDPAGERIFDMNPSKYSEKGEILTPEEKFMRVYAVDAMGLPIKGLSGTDINKRGSALFNRYNMNTGKNWDKETHLITIRSKTMAEVQYPELFKDVKTEKQFEVALEKAVKEEVALRKDSFVDPSDPRVVDNVRSLLKLQEHDGPFYHGGEIHADMIKGTNLDPAKYEGSSKPLLDYRNENGIRTIHKGHGEVLSPALRESFHNEYGIPLADMHGNVTISFDANLKIGEKLKDGETYRKEKIKVGDFYLKDVPAGQNEGQLTTSAEVKMTGETSKDMLAKTNEDRIPVEDFANAVNKASSSKELGDVLDLFYDRLGIDKSKFVSGGAGEAHELGAARGILNENLNKIYKNLVIKHVLSKKIESSGRLYASSSVKMRLDGKGQPARHVNDTEIILSSTTMIEKRLKEGDQVMVIRDPSIYINNVLILTVRNGTLLGRTGLGRENAVISQFNTRVRHQGDYDGDMMFFAKVGGETGIPKSYADAVQKHGGKTIPLVESKKMEKTPFTIKGIADAMRNQHIGDDQTSILAEVSRQMGANVANDVVYRIKAPKEGTKYSAYSVYAKGADGKYHVIQSGTTFAVYRNDANKRLMDVTIRPQWGYKEQQGMLQNINYAVDSKSSADINRVTNDDPYHGVKQVFRPDEVTVGGENNGKRVLEDSEAKALKDIQSNGIQIPFTISKKIEDGLSIDTLFTKGKTYTTAEGKIVRESLPGVKDGFDYLQNLKDIGGNLTPHQEKILSLKNLVTVKEDSEAMVRADQRASAIVRQVVKPSDVDIELPNVVELRKLAKAVKSHNLGIGKPRADEPKLDGGKNATTEEKGEATTMLFDFFFANRDNGKYSDKDLRSIAYWATTNAEADLKRGWRSETQLYDDAFALYTKRWLPFINAEPKIANAYYSAFEKELSRDLSKRDIVNPDVLKSEAGAVAPLSKPIAMPALRAAVTKKTEETESKSVSRKEGIRKLAGLKDDPYVPPPELVPKKPTGTVNF